MENNQIQESMEQTIMGAEPTVMPMENTIMGGQQTVMPETVMGGEQTVMPQPSIPQMSMSQTAMPQMAMGNHQVVMPQSTLGGQPAGMSNMPAGAQSKFAPPIQNSEQTMQPNVGAQPNPMAQPNMGVQPNPMVQPKAYAQDQFSNGSLSNGKTSATPVQQPFVQVSQNGVGATSQPFMQGMPQQGMGQPQFQQGMPQGQQMMGQNPQPKKKSPLIFVAIGVGVAAVLVGGFFATKAFFGKKNTTTSASAGDIHIKTSDDYLGEDIDDTTDPGTSAVSTGRVASGMALGVPLTPEMLWGEYLPVMGNKNADVYEDGAQFYEMVGHTTISVDDRNGGTYPVEFSALPIEITFGRAHKVFLDIPDPYSGDEDATITYYSYPTDEQREELARDFMGTYGEDGITYYNNYMKLFDTTFASITMSMEDGQLGSGFGIVELDGGTVSLYDVEIDKTTYELSHGEFLCSFDVEFEGRNLILFTDQSEVLYQPSDWSYYGEENGFMLAIFGYVAEDAFAYHDIAEVSYFADWGGNMDPMPFIRFTDGNYANNPFMDFEEDGTFTMGWESRYCPWGEEDLHPDYKNPVKFSGEYIWCGDQGIVLKLDGDIYYYQYDEAEYMETKVNDVDVEGMSEDQIAELITTQNNIMDDLLESLQAAGIEASVDEKGRVNMDTSILFGVDSDTISPEGFDMLDSFLEVYAEVILPYMEEGVISSVTIEGHTDPDGSFDYNLDLSQRRADAVADYCRVVQPELGNMIVAEGYSFLDPIYAEDGTVDKAASRRVVFTFILSY